MFYTKSGLPQEGEIILCTVTKVQFHSVFVSLNEYPNKSAMLHISEVSPGRIRNIRDYVKEGKVIVCKVLRIDSKKGHIDVSLRRVNENQRKEKVETLKQEQKAEKIVEFVAEQLKLKPRDLYDKIFKSVSNYEYLFEIFSEFVVDEFDLKTLKLDKKTETLLAEIIRQRIKPPKVEIKSKIKITSYDGDGVGFVKKLLIKIASQNKEKITLRYLGAGAYNFEIVTDEIPEAEKYYKFAEELLKNSQSKTCECSIERRD